jgi:glycosyltransferase involved in cell wall biosynthesis
MRYSAVIPVYNNETTLAGVVETLLKIPQITQVIAVDDGSRDRSPWILKQYGNIDVITHAQNRGKGAGIATGWNAAREDAILTVDADLAKLAPGHIHDMTNLFEADGWDMVVAARCAGYMPFAWLSGERVYMKKTVMPYAEMVEHLGNGIEQVINHAHRNKRVKLIISEDIGHVLKYQREPPHVAMMQYLREGWQLAKTEVYLRLNAP